MEHSFSSTPRQAPGEEDDHATAGSEGTQAWPQPEPLGAILRRVLGVLVEKALTTPDAYPLTANATLSGCNQKSNRDPKTNYEAHQVDDALIKLKDLGLAIRVLPVGGRTERWKHNVKEAWGLDRAGRAVLAELMLRGPQAEGELRARASRMAEIPSLEGLRKHLEFLTFRKFVRRLSPAGQLRGVNWTHLLYLPPELERVMDKYGQPDVDLSDGVDDPITASVSLAASTSAPAAAPSSSSPRTSNSDSALTDQLQSRVDELEQQVAELRQQLEQLADQHIKLDDAFQQLQRDLGT